MKKGYKESKQKILSKKEAITITELAYFLGTRRRVLERLIILDVIEPLSTDPEFSFSIELLPRLKKILRLRSQLGVSWSSMGLVLDLLDRIEEMEALIKENHM